MGLTSRWEVEGVEWEEAAKKVKMRKYQRAIDALEGLVVARIFEMTKMNQLQTGMCNSRLYAQANFSKGINFENTLPRHFRPVPLQFGMLWSITMWQQQLSDLLDDSFPGTRLWSMHS